MNYFFITGLPRSRTAWLANLFTTGESFCFHEGTFICGNDVNKLPHLLNSTGRQYAGTSDSSLTLYTDRVMEMFPEARHAVVFNSNIGRVRESLNGIFGFDTIDVMLHCVNDLLRYKSIVNPFVITTDELNDISLVRSLWNYCVPGLQFDEQRYQMLNDLNVQLTERAMDARRCMVCQHM